MEAGRTMPESRLMTMSSRPMAREPLRGSTMALMSGQRARSRWGAGAAGFFAGVDDMVTFPDDFERSVDAESGLMFMDLIGLVCISRVLDAEVEAEGGGG